MTQSNNILQELNDLNSSLAKLAPKNIYSVPQDYFDSLSDRVLNRIKAMDAVNVAEEMKFLSPTLNTISREMPYTIPSGYFERLDECLMDIVKTSTSNDHQTAKEEIESLSPLLSGMNKNMPFSVPEGYFETLQSGSRKEALAQAKVVSLSSRKWFRYAAAAVITGMIAFAGVLYFSNHGTKEAGSQALAKFTRDVKKMNDVQQESLIEYIDGGLGSKQDMAVTTPDKSSTDVKELLKGVSDKELKDLQDQTEGMEDVLMTN